MPAIDYFKEAYASLEKPVDFWKCVGLIYQHGLGHHTPSDMIAAYKCHFEDHPIQREFRLAPELYLEMQKQPHAFNRPILYMPMATERVYCASLVFVTGAGEFTAKAFDEYFYSVLKQLGIPEDNRLNSAHIFARTHLFAVTAYQDFYDPAAEAFCEQRS